MWQAVEMVLPSDVVQPQPGYTWTLHYSNFVALGFRPGHMVQDKHSGMT